MLIPTILCMLRIVDPCQIMMTPACGPTLQVMWKAANRLQPEVVNLFPDQLEPSFGPPIVLFRNKCDNPLMAKTFAFAFLLGLLLQACSPAPTASPSATDTPLPPTIAAPTQTPFIIVVTAEPTATATAEPVDGALEAILISMPGIASVITSPITVQGQSRPTFEQNLVVAVYDEFGVLLALTPTTLESPAGSPGNFSTELAFTVASEQPGRISVYETSARDGGVVHLASIEVTLRPSGAAEVVPAEFHFESIQIQFPAANDELSGATLTVSGYSYGTFESNLGLMLCGEGGGGAPNDLCGTEDNKLAAGNAMIDAPNMGQPGSFSGELNYTVTGPVQARIVVFAASPRDGGLLHVSSIPVVLVP